MVMQEDQPLSQLQLLAEAPIDTIPHGCDIPIGLFKKYRHSEKPIYLEVGSGTGEKAERIKNIFHGLVTVTDINEHAIKLAESRGLFGFTADAGNFFAERDDAYSLSWVELYPHVYMEGVLCNQEQDTWMPVLTNVDFNLMADGYFYFADIGRVDQPNNTIQRTMTREERLEYERAWMKRYEANQQAAKILGKKIADAQFMVVKPGEHKSREWGTADELVDLYYSDDFERWAQHLDWRQVNRFLTEIGLRRLYHRDTVFKSREDKPLPGIVEVWQKGSTFKYSPLHKGYTVEEATERSEKLLVEYLSGEEMRRRFLDNITAAVIHDHPNALKELHK
jgi:SAM-dependent methyltransferase